MTEARIVWCAAVLHAIVQKTGVNAICDLLLFFSHIYGWRGSFKAVNLSYTKSVVVCWRQDYKFSGTFSLLLLSKTWGLRGCLVGLPRGQHLLHLHCITGRLNNWLLTLNWIERRKKKPDASPRLFLMSLEETAEREEQVRTSEFNSEGFQKDSCYRRRQDHIGWAKAGKALP